MTRLARTGDGRFDSAPGRLPRGEGGVDKNMEHEVRRDVTDEEKRLWTAFRDTLERKQFETISVTQIGVQRLGLHETRCRQIVNTWANDGLVTAFDNGNKASLTEYGRQVDEIVSTNTGGESWR